MGFIVRDCVRCGVKHVQHNMVGASFLGGADWELAVFCQACRGLSIYGCTTSNAPTNFGNTSLDSHPAQIVVQSVAIRNDAIEPVVSEHVPQRVRDLFIEAAVCRSFGRYEAAGAIFRKTIDVASKLLYATDDRLKDRKPADALRSRLKSLGEMKILDEEIVELADVAALDGNDAAHDIDPYTADEAEALEDLTADLLDRLFVRPAKLAAVKAKQIAAGQRKG